MRLFQSTKEPTDRQIRRALRNALQDLWQSEIIDTGMRDLTIGKDGDYESETDWLNSKLSELVYRKRSNHDPRTQ